MLKVSKLAVWRENEFFSEFFTALYKVQLLPKSKRVCSVLF